MNRQAAIVARGNRERASLSAILGCFLLLAGCAAVNPIARVNPGPVDSTSSVAERVRQATRTDYKTPKFTDIPRTPKDVRSQAAWRQAVIDVLSERRPMNQWVAENPPILSGTEAFAESARASLPAGEIDAPPSDMTEATEAFARGLRADAAPPPPPQ